MTGKIVERESEEVRGMDELFRSADFAADDPSLKVRLWQKIRAKMAERELTEDELKKMVAARGETDFFGKLRRP